MWCDQNLLLSFWRTANYIFFGPYIQQWIYSDFCKMCTEYLKLTIWKKKNKLHNKMLSQPSLKCGMFILYDLNMPSHFLRHRFISITITHRYGIKFAQFCILSQLNSRLARVWIWQIVFHDAKKKRSWQAYLRTAENGRQIFVFIIILTCSWDKHI